MKDGLYKIKTWDQLAKEFDPVGDYSVELAGELFPRSLEIALPKNRIILVEDNHWDDWRITDEMIEETVTTRTDLLAVESANGLIIDTIVEPIMKYFKYAHLPEHLQKVSKEICDVAIHLDQSLPDGPEKSVGLRKLLEAKDCFVRALLEDN